MNDSESGIVLDSAHYNCKYVCLHMYGYIVTSLAIRQVVVVLCCCLSQNWQQ